MASIIHSPVSLLLFIDLPVDDLQNLELDKAQGDEARLGIECSQSEALSGPLLASLVSTHTLPTRKRVSPSEAAMALERRKWKVRAWLVLVHLPTSLSKG